jgi:hypothetical protein
MQCFQFYRTMGRRHGYCGGESAFSIFFTTGVRAAPASRVRVPNRLRRYFSASATVPPIRACSVRPA